MAGGFDASIVEASADIRFHPAMTHLLNLAIIHFITSITRNIPNPEWQKNKNVPG